MKHVLITGGSGLVGGHLSKLLQEKGYNVSFLSRSDRSPGGIVSYRWDPLKGFIDAEAVKGKDIIIHLAGTSIGTKRWSESRKKEIIDSRVDSLALLSDTINISDNRPQTFISSSAIGYYGAVTGEQIFNEGDPHGSDFLGETCKKWEDAADRISDTGIRVVKIRTGVVLDRERGALVKMSAPIRMGIGSPLGNGKQYIPWVHPYDLSNIYLKAIEDKNMVGAYNAVSPQHITNKEFSSYIAKVLDKPLWAPRVPAFVLRLFLGEMAGLILEGSRVSSEKLLTAGFKFKYPTLNDALLNIFLTNNLKKDKDHD